MSDAHIDKWNEQRQSIIGFGGKSTRKSYFPELQKRIEELDSSERDLSTLFHSVYDAIFIHDLDGNISDVNDSMLALYRVTREQALSYHVFDYCAPGEMVDRVKKYWGEIAAGKQSLTFEGQSLRPVDGSKIDVEVRLHRLKWQGVDQVVAVVKNITERKEAERTRIRDEARLEALLKLAQMANADTKTVSDFVLEQAINLTSSMIGFLAMVDEDQRTITMYSWSPSAMQACAIDDAPTVYYVEETGLWGEVVRQRRPIVTNDYHGQLEYKKGLPEGHVGISRYLSVPVMENGLVYGLVGVGNKEAEYDQGDIRQLTLLMEGMHSILRRKRDEDKVRESQVFLDTILANTPIALYYKDTKGVYQGCNKAFASLQGMEPRDLVGKTLFDLPYAAPRERLHELDVELFEKGEVQRTEITDVGPDGSFRHLMLHKAPYYDLNGNLKGLIGAILDLTESKAAEEALKRKSDELDRYFTTSLDLLCIADSDGRFVRLNDEWIKVLGYSIDDLIGCPFLEFVHPDDAEATMAATESLNKGEEVTNFVNRYRCKSGEYRWIEWRARPEDGQIFAAARDVTDRVQTEDALRRERDINDAIFNSIPGLIYLYNEEGKLVKWNAKHEQMTGFGPDELREKTLLDWYKDDLASQRAVLDGVKRTMETGFGEAEADLQTKSGAKIPMYFTASPVTVNGKSHFVGVGIDITERRRIQQALENRILALTQPLDDSYDIELDDLLDVADIQLLQDQFAKATGVASIITRINGQPITKPSNFCRLCQDVIRQSEKGLANCYKSDAALGMPNIGGPTVKPCLSGGLWDAGASIMIGGRHIASWLIGQVRNEAQNESAIRAYAKKIGVDEDVAVEAFNEVPSMSEEQFQNVAKALFTLAKQLSTVAYQNVQQARFIADRQKAAQELKQQLDLEHMIMELSGEYISLPPSETEAALEVAIRKLSEFLGVDRGFFYMFGNDYFDAGNMKEWCAKGIAPLQDSDLATPVEEVPAFQKRLIAGEVVLLEDTSTLPADCEAERRFVERFGIKSLISLPIQTSNKVLGFLAFETIRNYRSWTVGEVDLLRMFAHRVGSKLERNRYEEEIQRLNANLEQIVAERTEQLVESNHELESFAYSISHDLRAPLRSINGFSAALQHDYQDVLDETANDYINRIRTGATRMSDQIDGLLTLSRISRVKLELKQVDLSDIAYVIVGNLRDNEPNRKVEIDIEKGITVFGDERLVVSLMQNLIENAWKFTSTVPKAKIKVYAKVFDRIKACVVEDNGVGFEMAYADKLFGVFQRLHATTEFPGTGIGLATAHRIVQRHDGKIWAESEPGKGAKFMFVLGGPG